MNRPAITFSLTWEPEDIPVEGNVSAIDPHTDAENEQRVLSSLAAGDELAWCCIVVTATHHPSGLQGVNYLGAVTLESEADMPGIAWYHGMFTEALADLCTKMREMRQALGES